MQTCPCRISFGSRLPRRRVDGTGNAAACHVVLLASNNLTASRKGVPSLAWPVCMSTVNRPCPTMHPPLDPALSLRAYEIFVAHYIILLCKVRICVHGQYTHLTHRFPSLTEIHD